jgi:hypothetical protein
MANNQQAFPTVNGVECSFAEIAIGLDISGGGSFQGLDISGIKFDSKVSATIRKKGGRPAARTRGDIEFTASITLSRKALQLLKEGLGVVAPQSGNQRLISLVEFQIQVLHTPIGSSDIFESLIKRCRLTTDSHDYKEGADPDMIECELSVMQIAEKINGVEYVLL